jgi:hypothetical protein
MNKLLFFILVLGCLSVCSCSSNKSLTNETCEAKAQNYIDKWRNVGAIQAYTGAIEHLRACREPDKKILAFLSNCYYQLGLAQEKLSYFAATDTGQAYKSFKNAAVLLSEKNSYMTYELAALRCLIRTNDSSRLIAAYQTIKELENRPKVADTSFQLKQLRVYLKYQLKENDNPDLLTPYLKARTISDEGNLDWSQLENFLDDKPEAPFNKYYLGIVYWMRSKESRDEKQQKYLNKARTYLEEAMKNPDFPEQYHIIGDFFLENGDFKLAQKCFKDGFLKQDGNLFYKANYLTAQLKPLEQAFEYSFFSNINAYLPQFRALDNRLKSLFAESQLLTTKFNYDNLTQSIYKWRYWLSAISRDTVKLDVPRVINASDSPELNYYLGLYFVNQKDSTQAIRALTRGANATGGRIKAMSEFWLGYLEMDKVKAKKHFENALGYSKDEKKDKYADALYYKEILKSEKDWDEDNFDKVLKINPNYFAAYEKKGYIYLKSNKKEKAKADFDTLINRAELAQDTSFLFKGLIGKAFLDLNAARVTDWSKKKYFEPERVRYDVNTFLESYFYAQKEDAEEGAFNRGEYFNRYKTAFEQDRRIPQMVIKLVKPNLIRPLLTWYTPIYAPNQDMSKDLYEEDAISWTIRTDIMGKDSVEPIKFKIPKNAEIEKIELFLFDTVKPFKTFPFIPTDTIDFTQIVKVPAELIYAYKDSLSILRIKQTFKNKKFKPIESTKLVRIEKPNKGNTERKIAFIVQNANYQGNLELDKKTFKESEALEAVLKKHNFVVKPHRDLDTAQFQSMLDTSYMESIKDYNVILFYYTGHGVSSNGKNYLLPTNFKMGDSLTISTEMIYQKVEEFAARSGQLVSNLKDKYFVYIFDACRNELVTNTERRVEESNLIPHAVVVHTTQEGSTVDEVVKDSGMTAFATSLLKTLQDDKSKEVDLVQLLNLSAYGADGKSSNFEQKPVITSKLGFQLFILKH